jgi:TonB-dependent starch-binding outer membrane protein SusC
MRKLLIFVLTALYMNCAFAQDDILSKKINISFENVTLLDALTQLKDNHGVAIAFNSKQKELRTSITQTFENQSIESILKSLLTKSGMDYKLIDNHVVIYEKKK